MKTDIILAGVGGQGILSIAAIIGRAALANRLSIKQAEVHGMSQRGGDVQSHLRLSSREIHSDLIPLGGADVILSLEPMEALRYLPWLAKGGWVVASTVPFVNIENYPAGDAIFAELAALPHRILIDTEAVARGAGAPNSQNMSLLGAASVILDIDHRDLERAITEIFARKGEAVVEGNIAAFRAGRVVGEMQLGEVVKS